MALIEGRSLRDRIACDRAAEPPGVWPGRLSPGPSHLARDMHLNGGSADASVVAPSQATCGEAEERLDRRPT